MFGEAADKVLPLPLDGDERPWKVSTKRADAVKASLCVCARDSPRTALLALFQGRDVTRSLVNRFDTTARSWAVRSGPLRSELRPV
jgi:hypothetical protein